MKKQALIFLITFLLISQITLIAHADERENNNHAQMQNQIFLSQKNGDVKAKVNIKDDDNDKEEIENGDDKGKNLIKIDKNEFKIWGIITSYTENSSITINGQTIKIDNTVNKELKIVGNVKVGMYAKVEGNIVNNTMYAEKIIVDNREKVEISVTPSVSPSVTPSVSTTATPSVTPSITITPSVSPSATPSPSITPTVEQLTGPMLNNFIFTLENFLNSLKQIASKI